MFAENLYFHVDDCQKRTLKGMPDLRWVYTILIFHVKTAKLWL